MPSRRDLTFTLSTAKNPENAENDAGAQTTASSPALRFLVLGDFSRQGRMPGEFKSRRVTFDNFDRVLFETTGAFSSLEQFHPDFLAQAKPELRQLLQLRRGLKDAATRPAALAELARLGQQNGAAAAGAQGQGHGPAEAEPELLARLLGGRGASGASSENSAAKQSPAPAAAPTPAPAAAPTPAQAAVNRLLQHVLKTTPAASPTSSDRGPDDLAIELLNARCRSALLDPDFRDLERAWRSLYWLVSRLESDQGEVHLLDISKSELTEHLTGHARDLDASPLVQLLCEDRDGWDFLIGDYSFGLDSEDLMLLGNLGAIAARAGAPLLAHGDLSLAGCSSPELVAAPSEWSIGDPELAALAEQVRKHPAAKWVGLASPRFLVRHPYGKRADPIESFPFEELPANPDAERFLWGNPAFACAWILGQAHSNGGARWPLRQASSILDLPMPLYTAHSGDAIQPPLEFLLSEPARAAAERHGLIVFDGSNNVNRISTQSVHALAAT